MEHAHQKRPLHSVLLTGATGMIGGFLMARIARTGTNLHVLARADGRFGARERIDRTLRAQGLAPADVGARLRVIEGDVTLPRFGLSKQEFASVARECGAIIHAAADTGFSRVTRPEQETTNLEGTRHALDFALEAGALFCQISTAYLTGRTDGIVPEREIPLSHAWKNGYEATKHRAENTTHAICAERGIPYAIIRPSIISGATGTGTAFSFQGVYSFLRLFDSLQSSLRDRCIRFEANPDATVNLLPVDIATEQIWQLVRSTSGNGEVHHLVNPQPPTMSDLRNIWQRLFDIRVEFAPRGALRKDGNRLETAIRDSVQQYLPYLFGEPTFAMRRYDVSVPPLDTAYFERVLNYARRTRWGKQPADGAYHEPARMDSYPARYFAEFLPPKTGRLLVENLRSLSAAAAIRFTDEPGDPWRIHIERGVLVSVGRGQAGCCYHTDSATFERVARGLMTPQEAFFAGRVEISGDMETGLRVAAALEQFFSRYPYLPDALPAATGRSAP